MIETADRVKLGQTTYHLNGYATTDDEADLNEVDSDECQTLSEAKLLAVTYLRRGARTFSICRGTYEADDIEDDEYGLVLGVSWELDEEVQWHGYYDNDSGTIGWEEW